jgi:hypothetical protein
MDWQNMIGDLLNQYMSGQGATSRQEARAHYDQIADAVPTDVLGSVIGPALSSLGGQQVMERVFNSATEMNPEERSGLVRSLLNGFGSSGIDLTSLLGQLGINPGVADNPQEASPEEVAKLATHAQEHEPSIFNQAMAFYAEHPTLVKVLGTMAVAAIARNLTASSSNTNS